MRVLRSPAQLLSTVLDDAGTTAFPGDCRVCEGPLERIGAVPVCAMCLGRVEQTSTNQPTGCRQCGEAADLESYDADMLDPEEVRFAGGRVETILCRSCRLAAPDFERAVSFGLYQEELRDLVHLLKFERVPAVAARLGGWLAQAIAQLDGKAGRELLVIAVPLFAARQRQRGYNQSVLLADAALKQLRRTHPEWKLKAAHALMVRRRRTESQWVLAPRARRRNLEGAFKMTGDVRGREVLLVDDVMTSGATARECARVLKRAGADKVWVATLARAQRASAISAQDATASFARWDLSAAAAGEADLSAALRMDTGLAT